MVQDSWKSYSEDEWCNQNMIGYQVYWGGRQLRIFGEA